MATFGERIVGAEKLRSATYEDVEHSATAKGQAIAIVLSSIAVALGAQIIRPGDLLRMRTLDLRNI